MGMGMGMGMSCGLSQEARQELRQDQSLRQTVEQRQALTLDLRLDMFAALRGIRYTPTAKCPKCGRSLTTLEILKGFNNDPEDYTTSCSACNVRFNPGLSYKDALGFVEMPFFCSMQTLNQLKGLESLNPDDLKKANPAVYHSAIVHHGTLRNAFKKIGIKYTFDEVVDWKAKIRLFLGRLPDTVIAEVAGVSAKAIARQRKKHNVPRCTAQSMAEELE